MSGHEDKFFEGLGGKVAQKTKKVEPEPKEKTIEVPTPRPITSRNLFTNPEVSPVVLDLALLKEFKLDWFSWLADTLFFEIEQTFKTSIADVNRIKIQAVKTLHDIDVFWDQWEIFEKGVLALNGIIPRLDVVQPLDLPLLMVGVDIVNTIRKEDFAEQVARYTAACFLHENVHYAPPPLEFCQEYLSQPTYTCRHCGKVGSALPPFIGLCPACTRQYEQETPFSFKPDPEAIKNGEGKDLELKLTYDPEPTKKRLEELEKLSPSELPKAIKMEDVDVQAAKIIVATDHMNFRRGQLRDQLGSLKDWLGS